MQRTKLLLAALTVLFLTFGASAYGDALSQYYEEIRPVQPTQTNGKVEVVEVFYYGCIHCYHLEPYMKQWVETKPDYVEFRRMPVVFADSMMPLAKTFYAASKMGILDRVHQPLFDALNNEKQRIYDDNSIQNFIAGLGVDSEEFNRVFNSNEINTLVKQAFIMGQKYKVTGVPTLIVNGKYNVSPSKTGSIENLFKVVNELAAREQKEL